MSHKIAIVFFLGIALIQLFVPAKMIWDKEEILTTGREFKFRTAPIDPNDPFRGKYVVLRYKENNFDVPLDDEWNRGDAIYVLLKEDQEGFANIQSVSKTEPSNGELYVKAKVSYTQLNEFKTLRIRYPFERFYMEESKAYDAERAYRKSQIDSNQVAYGLIRVIDGEAVLKDVMIDGKSIKTIVEENQRKKQD